MHVYHLICNLLYFCTKHFFDLCHAILQALKILFGEQIQINSIFIDTFVSKNGGLDIQGPTTERLLILMDCSSSVFSVIVCRLSHSVWHAVIPASTVLKP